MSCDNDKVFDSAVVHVYLSGHVLIAGVLPIALPEHGCLYCFCFHECSQLQLVSTGTVLSCVCCVMAEFTLMKI